MPQYSAPLRDIRFVVYELLGSENFYKALPGDQEFDLELVDAILEEGAKFCENVIAPINQSGDEEGCSWSEEGVKTPGGFVEAYQQYVQNGWPALSVPAKFGGQGMPNILGHILTEMAGTANWAWYMYPGLSHGALATIESHGDEGQRDTYLPKLVSGEWTGTMCLTESHCGSDLGLLRTKAEPAGDGSYHITGTKIFISAGEHDMADNIVHIVLARLPDAPAGTRGISLFIVPKFLPNPEGEVGQRNNVHCGSIEKKMGIKASATCVMNFDNAVGYLIGPPNKGLNCMFTFMNIARIGTAFQGLAHAELSFQGGLAYAKERLQMRSLSGTKKPDEIADPIIVHPDVRRMLLTQKAFAEGGRAFLYYLSQQSDLLEADNADSVRANDLLALLTPIAKAFITETGYEAANHGVQIFGGHGFIHEWGMEQIVRDSRISMLYEGTTGIQALDLLGRKVLKTKGKLLKVFCSEVDDFCKQNRWGSQRALISELRSRNKEWRSISRKLGFSAMRNVDSVGAAAVDYLMYSGYVTLAYFWARMAVLASSKLDDGVEDAAFYEAKIKTAQFYFDRLLPRVDAHKQAMLSGSDNLLSLEEEQFCF